MTDSIKWTWEIQSNDQGFFVDETTSGEKGFVRYGPIPDRASALALASGLRAVKEAFVAKRLNITTSRPADSQKGV